MNRLGNLNVSVQHSPGMAFIYFNAPFFVRFFRFCFICVVLLYISEFNVCTYFSSLLFFMSGVAV